MISRVLTSQNQGNSIAPGSRNRPPLGAKKRFLRGAGAGDRAQAQRSGSEQCLAGQDDPGDLAALPHASAAAVVATSSAPTIPSPLHMVAPPPRARKWVSRLASMPALSAVRPRSFKASVRPILPPPDEASEEQKGSEREKAEPADGTREQRTRSQGCAPSPRPRTHSSGGAQTPATPLNRDPDLPPLAASESGRSWSSSCSSTGTPRSDGSGRGAGLLKRRMSSRLHKFEWDALVRQDMLPCYILNPNSRFKTCWDLLTSAIILYCVIAIPVMVGFAADMPQDLFTADYAVDVIFGIDILFNFFTAFSPAPNRLETGLLPIARHYVRSGWFFIDLLGVLPLNDLVGLFEGDRLQVLQSLKLVRALRMARLARLLKLRAISRLLQRFYGMRVPVYLRVMPLMMQVMFMAHVMGCLFHYVGAMGLETERGESWLVTQGIEHDSMTVRYVASLYWTVATMLGVGYGDVHAVTEAEQILSIIVQLVGSCMFGFVVGSITAFIEVGEMRKATLTRRVMEALQFSKQRALPAALQQSILAQYAHLARCKSVFDEEAVMQALDPHLRTGLSIPMRKHLAGAFPHTVGKDSAIWSHVLPKMHPFLAAPGDVLLPQDVVASGIAFLVQGVVAEEVRVGKPPHPAHGLVFAGMYTAGATVGDASVLCNLSSRTTYLCVTDCQLFQLSNTDVWELACSFPEWLEHWRATAEQGRESSNTVLDELQQWAALESGQLRWGGPRPTNSALPSCTAPPSPIARSPTARSLRQGVSVGALSATHPRSYRAARVPPGNLTPAEATSTSALPPPAQGGEAGGWPLGALEQELAEDAGASVRGSWGAAAEAEGLCDAPAAIPPLGARVLLNGSMTVMTQELAGLWEAAQQCMAASEAERAELVLGLEETAAALCASDAPVAAREASTTSLASGNPPPGHAHSLSSSAPSASHSATNSARPPFVCHPSSNFRLGWDALMGLLTCYVFLVVPFRMAFSPNSAVHWTDFFVDGCFAADIAINFRTGFVNENNKVVLDPRVIAAHYFRTWLPFDLLATIPFDAVSQAAFGTGSFLMSLRLLRFVRVIRLAKLLRLASLKKRLTKLSPHSTLLLRRTRWWQAGKFALTALIIGHVLGCLFFMISSLNEEYDGRSTWWTAAGTR